MAFEILWNMALIWNMNGIWNVNNKLIGIYLNFVYIPMPYKCHMA